jgi:hypothetical protein
MEWRQEQREVSDKSIKVYKHVCRINECDLQDSHYGRNNPLEAYSISNNGVTVSNDEIWRVEEMDSHVSDHYI